MKHANLPYHLYVWVNNRYLGPAMPEGVTYGLWHGIHSRGGQIPMAHVLLETGAHWSGLPLHAMSLFTGGAPKSWVEKEPQELCPWAAMGEHIEAWGAHYLEGMQVEYVKPGWGGRHTGIIVDWCGGFDRHPQEHKPLNLIALNEGQFALIPNNYCRFRDDHLVDSALFSQTAHYRRNETVWWGD